MNVFATERVWMEHTSIEIVPIMQNVCKIWHERHLIYYFNIQSGLICIIFDYIDWMKEEKEGERERNFF